MVSVNSAAQLTPVERFSLTAKCTRKMMEWNNKEKNKLLWKVTDGVVGVVAVIFAIIADFFIHIFLAFGKALAALPAKPVQIFAKIPQDLELYLPSFT